VTSCEELDDFFLGVDSSVLIVAVAQTPATPHAWRQMDLLFGLALSNLCTTSPGEKIQQAVSCWIFSLKKRLLLDFFSSPAGFFFENTRHVCEWLQGQKRLFEQQ
jgi:pyrroloquinoline quinone (PQQ) biosynthesis protein C